jgi:fatty acid desaturase
MRPRTPEGFAEYGEPEWMRSISNSTICTWFYTFYIANLIVFFLVIAAASYIFIYGKRHFTVSNLFFALLQLIVAGTNMLFFYLMCDRSLKP